MENKKYPLYSMTLCMFQREEKGTWEPGLLFNDGQIILDQMGNIPDTVWDYQRRDYILTINLEKLMKDMA